jgi:hypothetical protein
MAGCHQQAAPRNVVLAEVVDVVEEEEEHCLTASRPRTNATHMNWEEGEARERQGGGSSKYPLVMVPPLFSCPRHCRTVSPTSSVHALKYNYLSVQAAVEELFCGTVHTAPGAATAALLLSIPLSAFTREAIVKIPASASSACPCNSAVPSKLTV